MEIKKGGDPGRVVINQSGLTFKKKKEAKKKNVLRCGERSAFPTS